MLIPSCDLICHSERSEESPRCLATLRFAQHDNFYGFEGNLVLATVKVKMSNTNLSIIEKLKKASDGLLFMSESDYPFGAFFWEASENTAITPEKILQQTGHPADTPIEAVDLDAFFAVATTEQDWYEQEERETLKRFQNLVETLKNNLTDIKVYRVGTTTIDVYIVGKTPSGDLAGLSTKVVET